MGRRGGPKLAFVANIRKRFNKNNPNPETMVISGPMHLHSSNVVTVQPRASRPPYMNRQSRRTSQRMSRYYEEEYEAGSGWMAAARDATQYGAGPYRRPQPEELQNVEDDETIIIINDNRARRSRRFTRQSFSMASMVSRSDRRRRGMSYDSLYSSVHPQYVDYAEDPDYVESYDSLRKDGVLASVERDTYLEGRRKTLPQIPDSVEEDGYMDVYGDDYADKAEYVYCLSHHYSLCCYVLTQVCLGSTYDFQDSAHPDDDGASYHSRTSSQPSFDNLMNELAEFSSTSSKTNRSPTLSLRKSHIPERTTSRISATPPPLAPRTTSKSERRQSVGQKRTRRSIVLRIEQLLDTMKQVEAEEKDSTMERKQESLQRRRTMAERDEQLKDGATQLDSLFKEAKKAVLGDKKNEVKNDEAVVKETRARAKSFGTAVKETLESGGKALQPTSPLNPLPTPPSSPKFEDTSDPNWEDIEEMEETAEELGVTETTLADALPEWITSRIPIWTGSPEPSNAKKEEQPAIPTPTPAPASVSSSIPKSTPAPHSTPKSRLSRQQKPAPTSERRASIVSVSNRRKSIVITTANNKRLSITQHDGRLSLLASQKPALSEALPSSAYSFQARGLRVVKVVRGDTQLAPELRNQPAPIVRRPSMKKSNDLQRKASTASKASSASKGSSADSQGERRRGSDTSIDSGYNSSSSKSASRSTSPVSRPSVEDQLPPPPTEPAPLPRQSRRVSIVFVEKETIKKKKSGGLKRLLTLGKGTTNPITKKAAAPTPEIKQRAEVTTPMTAATPPSTRSPRTSPKTSPRPSLDRPSLDPGAKSPWITTKDEDGAGLPSLDPGPASVWRLETNVAESLKRRGIQV